MTDGPSPTGSPSGPAGTPSSAAPDGTPDDAADGSPEALRELILDHVRTIPDYPSPGIRFKDITPLLADPAAFAEVVSALAAPHRPGTGAEVDLVAGIEARGFILAAPVALALGLGFVPIRKKGKLPHATASAEYALEYGTAVIEVHLDAAAPGQRILLIDDVLATGGTAEAACGLLESLGATIDSVAFLLGLQDLGGCDRLAGRSVRILAGC